MQAEENAAEKTEAEADILRKELEENDARVTRGASLEPSKENTQTFDDETLKDSAPFERTVGKRKPVQVSPFDSTSATQEKESTKWSRLSRALNHPRNGLARYVRYWAAGGIVRCPPPSPPPPRACMPVLGPRLTLGRLHHSANFG